MSSPAPKPSADPPPDAPAGATPRPRAKRTRAKPQEEGEGADLRETLIEASMAVLAEEGLEGFSLRRVSARAGVSHAAPRSHFQDFAGLRAAVAMRGFGMLGDALRRGISAATPNRSVRAEAAMLAYVDFATAHPGLFGLMFSLHPREDRDGRAGAALRAALAPMHEIARDLDLPLRDHPLGDGRSPGIYLWLLAHGQAQLLLGGGHALAAPPAGAEEDSAPDLRRIAPRMLFISPYRFETLDVGPGAPALPRPRER